MASQDIKADQADDADQVIAGERAVAFEAFYAYGHLGREMIAVRAPHAFGETELIGALARIDGALYDIVGIGRRLVGPIAKGEPFGLAVRPRREAR